MKVGITETVLRDAPQSLIATRMRYEEFADILPTLDQVGYYSLECWGGATFDACMRFLDEDPWERLRNIREKCPNSKLQMLLRGQNLLGYKHYPDDVVRKFIQLAVGNGIDIIRIFDALNDLRNLETSVAETVSRGADAQVAIAYTTSPVHTLENYAVLARRIEEMGATSICIKDMAGIMTPRESRDLVTAIKGTTKLRLHVHAHATTGLATMAYLKAVEVGADVVDTAISSFSGGTSQPATETVVFSLEQLGYETGVNWEKLKEVNDFFRPLRQKYLAEGLLDPQVLETDVDSLNYQIPGGMLSNLISQLKAAGQIDKLPQIIAETPRVRADLGYPPLVTPTSQVVGAQATANVLAGERYKVISKEVRAYLRGEYGAAPGQVNEDLIAKALGDTPRIKGRFADALPDGLAAAAQGAGALAHSPEDVLSYAMFPQVFEQFARERDSEAETVFNLPEPSEPRRPSDGFQATSSAASISDGALITRSGAQRTARAVLPPSGNPGLAAPEPKAGAKPILGNTNANKAKWLDYTITEKFDVDESTAALLMAIVAHHMRAEPEHLTFKSIRER
ncbi:MAG: pyruvate carboxylase subunit B [Cellulomonadaceae bacterium]|jgi:oxaloacetate decarboxylase alpha subunit|nr:pyruvate carboxylase subunit B [Cellulomonadaceae bacterium]